MEPKQKILIVDDSEINRAMLKEILGESYEYLEAENGLRAIEILRRRTDIALVLLDLIMPEMDGFDVLRVMQCLCMAGGNPGHCDQRGRGHPKRRARL